MPYVIGIVLSAGVAMFARHVGHRAPVTSLQHPLATAYSKPPFRAAFGQMSSLSGS